MKTRNKWTALILLGALVLSLLSGCAGTPANDGTPAATPEDPLGGTRQEPGMNPEPETGSETEPESESKTGKVLVVYYSATGSTEAVAGYIANATGGDTFAITPAEPYTADDLNWRDNSSRVSKEHDDASLRVMELTETTVDGWADYDTVFIGYPIWWGNAAWPVNDFVKNNDFTGKTVIPFCTSTSSGLGQSGALLAEMAKGGSWQEGRRFSWHDSQSDIAAWVNGLTY